MIHLAMDSAVSAENASRFQQPLGKPLGFPTDSTATTTTRYSRCPPKRGRSEKQLKLLFQKALRNNSQTIS